MDRDTVIEASICQRVSRIQCTNSYLSLYIQGDFRPKKLLPGDQLTVLAHIQVCKGLAMGKHASYGILFALSTVH